MINKETENNKLISLCAKMNARNATRLHLWLHLWLSFLTFYHCGANIAISMQFD